MDMTYQHRKTCLVIALAASVIGAVVSAAETRSAIWSLLTATLVFLAALMGVAKGNQAMRRTGTINEHDYMSAESIGCGIGLLLGAAVCAGLVAIFSGG